MENKIKFRLLKRSLIIVLLVSFFVLPSFIILKAAEPPLYGQIFGKLEEVAGQRGAGLTSQDIRLTAVLAIRALLHLIGLLFLILIIIGGVLWMTSGGNEEKVTKARKLLVSSVIGLGVILISLSVVSFILNQIYNYVFQPIGGGWNPLF